MADAQPLGQAVPIDPIRTRVSLLALIGALLLSLVGDRLFYEAGRGLNFPLWSLLLLGAWWGVMRAGHWSASRTQAVLIGLAWLCAALVAWRDSVALNTLAILSALLLVSVAAYPWMQGLTRGSLLEYCVLMPLYTVAQVMGGLLLLLLSDVKWRRLSDSYSLMDRLRRGLTGLLLALPFLVLFGILFASADAVFHTFLKNMFELNIDPERLWLMGFLAWLAGGLLRLLLLPEDLNLDPSVEQATRASVPRMGALELGVALGLINLLFLSFVLVQLRYLFGGASLVRITPNLTYADYARHGFGQLVVASLLTLPMLLLFEWLTNRENRTARRTFQVMAAGLIALLSVVMASAWYRLWLYQQAYGLTELRLYAAASMVWVGLVLLWFLLTVLPGRRERFSFGAMLLLMLVIIGLHGLNPDALIARVNLTRALQGKPLDTEYLTSLSADAIPTILTYLPRLKPAQQEAIRERLQKHPAHQAPNDWRSWNWSRVQGKRSLKADWTNSARASRHERIGGMPTHSSRHEISAE
jgi:hypothetical protein